METTCRVQRRVTKGGAVLAGLVLSATCGSPGSATTDVTEFSIERSRILPELTGRRLDGVEESVSAYRGRVLLIDVWATWCRPCIAALPELRALVAELPADRFALLAISLDGALATVTDFMETEPMPWYNWHVGMGSEVERALAIRGLPAYLLVNEEGVILANEGPLARLRCMAERAVAGDDPHGCTPANWWLPRGLPPAAKVSPVGSPPGALCRAPTDSGLRASASLRSRRAPVSPRSSRRGTSRRHRRQTNSSRDASGSRPRSTGASLALREVVLRALVKDRDRELFDLDPRAERVTSHGRYCLDSRRGRHRDPRRDRHLVPESAR